MVAALYALLAYGSYVTLPSHAGGMQGFDMRPLGMSGADGMAYMAAMTEAGRDYYLNWLEPLDFAFIVALTGLILTLCWCFRGLSGGLAAVGVVSYALCDLVENTLVSSLMAFGSTSGAGETIAAIATVTTGKFASLVVAAIALAVAWRQSAGRTWEGS